MKRILAIVLTVVMVLGLSIGAMAAPSEKAGQAEKSMGEVNSYKEKAVEVALTGPDAVYVGQEAVFSAVTLKKGSSYADEWVCTSIGDDNTINTEEGMITKGDTTPVKYEDGSTYYEAEATFKSDKAGVFTVTYNIMMRSGISGVYFIGTASKEITVLGSSSNRTVEDFDIIGYHFQAQGDTQENPSEMNYWYQLVATKVTVRYSDGTIETLSSDAGVFRVGGFKPSQTTRTVEIEFLGCEKTFTFRGPWAEGELV